VVAGRLLMPSEVKAAGSIVGWAVGISILLPFWQLDYSASYSSSQRCAGNYHSFSNSNPWVMARCSGNPDH
jgi:hypothetical protein